MADGDVGATGAVSPQNSKGGPRRPPFPPIYCLAIPSLASPQLTAPHRFPTLRKAERKCYRRH
jgi:hypothetical protein